MAENNIRLHRARNDRPPATRKQIRVEPALLNREIVLHSSEERRVLVDRAAEKSKARVLDHVLVLQCHQERLDARRFQPSRRSWNDVFDCVVDDKVVHHLRGDVEPGMESDLDEEAVSEGVDDGVRDRAHDWRSYCSHTSSSGDDCVDNEISKADAREEYRT